MSCILLGNGVSVMLLPTPVSYTLVLSFAALLSVVLELVPELLQAAAKPAASAINIINYAASISPVPNHISWKHEWKAQSRNDATIIP